MPNWMEIEEQYQDIVDRYGHLGLKLQDRLITLLEASKIDYLLVKQRVKKFSSFKEKIERKNYSNPFEQVMDICGLRIVYYRPIDKERIIDLIRQQQFIEVDFIDKNDTLSDNQFDYTASHIVLKIPANWQYNPEAFLMFEGLMVEVQLVTIAEHWWADMSHKFMYKGPLLDPSMRKRIYQIKAILDNVDSQVAEMSALISGSDSTVVPRNNNLNEQNLREFLNRAFPEREKLSNDSLVYLLQEVNQYVDNIEVLNSYWNSISDRFNELELESFNALPELQGLRWREDGALRTLLMLFNKNYWMELKNYMPEFEREILLRWKNILGIG